MSQLVAGFRGRNRMESSSSVVLVEPRIVPLESYLWMIRTCKIEPSPNIFRSTSPLWHLFYLVQCPPDADDVWYFQVRIPFLTADILSSMTGTCTVIPSRPKIKSCLAETSYRLSIYSVEYSGSPASRLSCQFTFAPLIRKLLSLSLVFGSNSSTRWQINYSDGNVKPNH